MGIQGLLPYVEKACQPCRISDFRGYTIAVDAYCWLHKGVFGCAPELARGQQTHFYVDYCMKFVKCFLENDIKVILVFDGASLPAKKQTNETRKQRREIAREKGHRSLAEGNHNEANGFFRQSMNITSEMVGNVIQACKTMGNPNVHCIVAPYEADAQLAYLNLNGFADAVLSEDSDLIVFGCKKIIFKSDQFRGTLYDIEKLPAVFSRQRTPFDFATFRRMCILSGCDYAGGLTGFGLVRAEKFFQKTMSSSKKDIRSCLKRIPLVMNSKAIKVNDDYVDQFLAAENTFTYQLVFDPKQRRLLPLNPYPNGLNADCFPYAGKMLDDHLATEIAVGHLCPHTHQPRSKTVSAKQESIALPPIIKRRSPKKSPMKPLLKSPRKGAFEMGHVRNVVRLTSSPKKKPSTSRSIEKSTLSAYGSISDHSLTRSRYFVTSTMAVYDTNTIDTAADDKSPIKEKSSPFRHPRKRNLFDEINSQDEDNDESEESGFFDSGDQSTPTSSFSSSQGAKKVALGKRTYSFRAMSQESTGSGTSPLLASFTGMFSQFQYRPKRTGSQDSE